jgi:hypothetical protein
MALPPGRPRIFDHALQGPLLISCRTLPRNLLCGCARLGGAAVVERDCRDL